MARTLTPPWLVEALDGLPHLATVDEAAAVLRVPPATVRSYITRGKLQRVRYGGPKSRVRVTRDSIRDLLLDGLAGREEVA